MTQNAAITAIQVSASGGQTPYTYSISDAPSGIAIHSSNGRITGTPTKASSFTLTVKVTDKANKTATESFSMAVSLNSHFFFLHKYWCFCIFSRLSTQNNRVLITYK
ncbi:MAG: Ig domain-containing protein [Gemmatimonadota bacterium]|nr:Ig domain-containing protein [Gemmatimonadota bacterium]